MRDTIINWPRGSALLLASASFGIILGNPGILGTMGAMARPAPAPVPLPGYARVADLVTSVTAIAVVKVKSVTAVPLDRAQGLAAGNRRFLVAAETISLIRGNNVISREIGFLIDLPGDEKSKPPKWKNLSFIVFGQVGQRVDFFQLLNSNALLQWSAETEAMIRKVSAQFAAPDAPPAIHQVNSAFHVAGTVEGEGETQIFLETTKGDQISLSIVRRPDEKPQFGAALGEVVDEAASLPAADTPLWYQLACGLPDRLPARALEGQDAAQASAAARDYRAFIEALAPCNRAPTPLP